MSNFSNFPPEWVKTIEGILCRMSDNSSQDTCGLQRGCQTLTSLSDFTQDGTTACWTFVDENGISFTRCLEIGWLLGTLFDGVDSTCIGISATDWSNMSIEERIQAIVDDVLTCCNGTTTTTTTSTTTTTTLPFPIACGEEVIFAGGESFPFIQEVVLGTDLGVITFDFDAFDIPDKFVVVFDGIEVINTGYRGDTAQQTDLDNELILRGYPTETIVSPGNDSAFFNKTTTTSVAFVYIYGPLPDTEWNFTVGCPPEVTTTTTTTTETPTTTTTTTTETSTTTTTTETPTVMVTNSLPGTTITDVNNVPGFNLFTDVGVGESSSGFHNAFTGSIQMILDGPPLFNGNAALEKNGIVVDCVAVTTGGIYPMTINFTVQTFFLSNILHVSLNIGPC